MGLTAFNRHRRAKAAAARKAAAAEAVEADESKTTDTEGPGDKPLDAEMVAMGDTNALGSQPAGSEAMGTEGQQAAEGDENATTGDDTPVGAKVAQATAEGQSEADAATEPPSEFEQAKAAAAEAGLTRGSSTGAWREFAQAHGFSEADANELSRDELAEHFLGPKA